MAAASTEPASEAVDARKHIEAEPMNELRFSMPCGSCLKTKPTSFLIAYRLWSKTPVLRESLRTRCSLVISPHLPALCPSIEYRSLSA
jgi:hypothetical protein